MNSEETREMADLLERATALAISSPGGGPPREGIFLACSPATSRELAQHIVELDELASMIGLSVDRYKVGNFGDKVLTRCSDCGGVLESEWPDEPVTGHEKWCVYRKALELTGRKF